MAADPEAHFTLLERDVPDVLADSFLGSFRSNHDAYSQAEWDALTKTHPNLRQFIGSLSSEIAPADAALRGKITSSMMGLLCLLEEAKTGEEMEGFWETSPSTADEAA